MKLTDLEPSFYGSGGEGITDAEGKPVPERRGIGVMFNCPCGCSSWCAVPFKNPIDGGPQVGHQGWAREGETFETLTLKPSILRLKWKSPDGKENGCGWHGYITNGEVSTC